MSATKRRPSWAALSVVVAALSLAAGLIFNGKQVEDGANSQRQAKIATELGLLTQLQDAINRAVYSRVPYTREFDELRSGRRSALGPAAYRVTAEEASTMDYFAWLFNNGYLSAQGADVLWGPRMICEYQQAFAPAFQEAARDLPALAEFIQRRGRTLAPLERC